MTVTNEAIGIQRFETADAPSDEPGTVEIDLPPNEYGVYADTDQRAPRWASTTANIQLVGDQHVELAIYRPEERETLHVRSADSVKVEVERTDDGFTLAKTVQEGVYEGLPYASGDREGSVQFALYPGEYLVRGTDVHGTTQEQRIVVDEGGKMELAELEPPEERREVPVTFRVLDVSDDSESTPVSHMIVKGHRYDSDNDESGEGTAFESPPTNRDGETTVDLAMGEQYIAWVETLQGSYIDPTRVHRSSKGVFRVRSPEMTLDVEIKRS